MITKYHGLSTNELLRHVHDKRTSPVIEELCTRLENYLDTKGATEDELKCPVCEAGLKLIPDEDDELTLKVRE